MLGSHQLVHMATQRVFSVVTVRRGSAVRGQAVDLHLTGAAWILPLCGWLTAPFRPIRSSIWSRADFSQTGTPIGRNDATKGNAQ